MKNLLNQLVPKGILYITLSNSFYMSFFFSIGAIDCFLLFHLSRNQTIVRSRSCGDVVKIMFAYLHCILWIIIHHSIPGVSTFLQILPGIGYDILAPVQQKQPKYYIHILLWLLVQYVPMLAFASSLMEISNRWKARTSTNQPTDYWTIVLFRYCPAYFSILNE